MIRYAEVALNIPFSNTETLTYEIPPSMESLQVGCRVEVPLRKKIREAVVLEIHNLMPAYKTELIYRQIDKSPVITKEQVELAYWMRDYYLASLGECLYKMVPSGRRTKSPVLADVQVEKNLLSLNVEQEKAFQTIKAQFGKTSTHLLYGVTGSGKTEVYIHLIYEFLKTTNQSAILLVPEIALTVQILKRLEIIFGNELALLHSALKTTEKYMNYLQVLRGEKRIVIGTRSAIFAPVRNLGLIILDEEHDSAYKEHSSPRYHARQIAMKRSQMNQAVLVLGSATPNIETYYHAKNGSIHLHELTQRAKAQNLPKIQLVKKNFSKELLSSDLLFSIKQRLERKEQVIILLNRRAYSPLIYNRMTQEFVKCKHCSVSLSYHKDGKLRCHFCGFTESFLQFQKEFGKENLELMGAGTQKLEEYLLEKFPNAKIERLDQDVTQNSTIMAEILTRLINHEVDILTGTQMIAKGLDISRVTLVGVVNAEMGLGIPDFRSSERVFSLLTQVAGRAGRGELSGEVMIESENILHPVIQLAKLQDYKKFFNEEIKVRHQLFYPPFCRLIRLVIRSKKEEKTKEYIQKLANDLKSTLGDKEGKEVFILGPTECPFSKLESYYRSHILLKAKETTEIREILRKKLTSWNLPNEVYLEIDIDPVELV